jgi:hypothetical protein
MLFLESIDDLGLEVQVGSANFRRLKPFFTSDLVEDVSVNNGDLLPARLQNNGTFEVNTTGWSPGAYATLARSTVQKNSGVASMQVTRNSALGGNCYAAQTVSGLVIGARYYWEAWIRSGTSGTNLPIECSISNIFYTNTVTASTTWQKISRHFLAAATSYVFYIRCEQAGMPNGANWYMDDVVCYRDPLYVSCRSNADLVEDVQIPSAALSIADPRDSFGTATLDEVSVLMEGTLDVLDAVVLEGTGDAEMDIPSAELTIDVTNWLDGSIDVDVDLGVSFILMGFFLGDTEPMDMDLLIEDIGRIPVIIRLTQVNALLYKVMVTSDNYTVGALLLLDEVSVRTRASLTLRRIRKVVLPPEPEPAVSGDPPAAGGVNVRALWGVVVDMDTPTITEGIPK